MRKKAFTLSEVLIVIAILGVVAMLTVTNSASNVDENKNILALKSTMGQVDAAIAKIVSEYGSFEEYRDEKHPGADYMSIANIVGEAIRNQMSINKGCGTWNISSCFSIANLRGNATCAYAFILSNGASICMKSGNTTPVTMFIDVDGPNNGEDKYGSDKFEFLVTDEGLDFIKLNQSRKKATTANNYDKFVSGDETEWAFTVGNQDYLICPNSLSWVSKKSCN